MSIDSERDLLALLRVGHVVALTLRAMQEAVRPGMTTAELDGIGAELLRKHGAQSAPITMYNFPGHTCISINDEAAHGIPGPRVIQPGDLVNVDVSAVMDGYYADTGGSVAVPPVTAENRRLLSATKAALQNALDAVSAGRPLNVIGRAVELEARKGGFSIIRELGGHGIGHKLHEEPRNVPNYYTKRASQTMREGQVMTIEPFLTTGGNGRIVTAEDGWTLKTANGANAAQFEHTIVITRGKPTILTAV